MMRFKKIYIEITNSCNLNCSFCVGNRREVKFLSFSEFKLILDRIKPYCHYLYFHILGEPLLHPDIKKFINYASDMGFYINITTNGYLINKIKDVSNIRQLNISLHSFNSNYNKSLDKYMNDIFDVIDNMTNTYISLRLWVDRNDSILNIIRDHYHISDIPIDFDRFKLSDNIFLSKFHKFIWPDLSNNYYNDHGKCYGLIDHIGILSDGSIVPCCLDSNADICLGNIFENSLDEILNTSRVKDMISGFKKNYKCEEFCRHCNFLDK